MVDDDDLGDLPATELKRRIEAARILRGITQVTLNEMFEADGLDKTEAGRLERGKLDLSRASLEALARNLRVPREWFTEADTDRIVGLRPVFGQALNPGQRAALHEAAELLAGLSLATGQVEPPPHEVSAGQDRSDRPARSDPQGG